MRHSRKRMHETRATLQSFGTRGDCRTTVTSEFKGFRYVGCCLVLSALPPYKDSGVNDVSTLMAEESTRHERELVADPAEPRLKRPPLYQVVLLNDDYTPMEFVVDVLERIFGMDRTTATRVMLEVHTKGKGVCGVFTFEIAETKVAQVTTYARQHQHPLLCTMEET
jgi:ATP-dependent Clp protease adaptor protein ClpS